jgi:hypothetical protein
MFKPAELMHHQIGGGTIDRDRRFAKRNSRKKTAHYYY